MPWAHGPPVPRGRRFPSTPQPPSAIPQLPSVILQPPSVTLHGASQWVGTTRPTPRATPTPTTATATAMQTGTGTSSGNSDGTSNSSNNNNTDSNGSGTAPTSTICGIPFGASGALNFIVPKMKRKLFILRLSGSHVFRRACSGKSISFCAGCYAQEAYSHTYVDGAQHLSCR